MSAEEQKVPVIRRYDKPGLASYVEEVEWQEWSQEVIIKLLIRMQNEVDDENSKLLLAEALYANIIGIKDFLALVNQNAWKPLEVLYTLFLNAYSQKQFMIAVYLIKEAYTLDPTNPDVVGSFIRLLQDLGQTDDAAMIERHYETYRKGACDES